MGQLNLRLLGPPEIDHGERRVEFPTRKTQALLFYLALERGPHSREKLADLLWPESNLGRAQASFRRCLAYLRRSLGEGSTTNDAGHLFISRDHVGFNDASDHRLDVFDLLTA